MNRIKVAWSTKDGHQGYYEICNTLADAEHERFRIEHSPGWHFDYMEGFHTEPIH